jgi:Rrf2 family protein
MQLFSKSAEYTLRALTRVAETGFEQPFNAATLCSEINIPLPFARKGFQHLVRAEILRATRGPGGGYCLKRPAESITLYDVIVAMDGAEAFNTCPLGVETACPPGTASSVACATCKASHPACGIESVCPIHETWQIMRRLVIDKFKHCTLRDIQHKWQGQQGNKTAAKRRTPQKES